MATATKKSPSPAPTAAGNPPPSPGLLGGFLRVCDAIYRFLSSLKLAVITILTLAATLAYATFFESWYGAGAAQEWIYKSKGFSILLAFLAMNILCAALIRFPWKKRQIGFVITHAGLLTLLAGSFQTLETADEGQVGMLEGDVKKQLIRLDFPKIRVWPVDPESKKAVAEECRELDFRPGNFAWGPGIPRPRGLLDLASRIGLGGRGDEGEVLTRTGDPFRFVVKSHIPASVFTTVRVDDPGGVPMAKIRPQFKAPGMPRARDVFEEDRENWFEVEPTFRQAVKSQGPAEFAFLYVDRPELVDDFLNPPRDSGQAGVARLHYTDRAGKSRRYDWALDGQADKTVTLPESDLAVTYVGSGDETPEEKRNPLEQMLRKTSIAYAHFTIRRADGPPADYYGMAMLPMAPNLLPTERGKPLAHAEPLVRINYYLPPALDPKTNGRFGMVEVVGTPDRSLYYRVFGRSKAGRSEVRAVGPVALGKETHAFGGTPDIPMTLSFRVEDYLPSGIEKEICVPFALPKNQQGEGIPASLVEMTVDGHTREFWVRRSASLDPTYQRVKFPSGEYEISYDVDRKDLGFQLHLDDFDVGFDPGTDSASSFESKVRLTDEALGIKDEPHKIWMNHTLTHRGYTFYQSGYRRHVDPETGRETGEFLSIFQVGKDPGRTLKYLGCVMVVLGAFVQFYMRAGLFTDGGKRERSRIAARERKRAGTNGQAGPGATTTDVTESEESL